MSQLTDATPAERHRLVADDFTRLIEGTTAWDAPTPVLEWQVGDIVDHLTGWLPGFLEHIAGVALMVPDADERLARWLAQRDAVQALLESDAAREPVETTMFGTMPLQNLVDQFYTADVYMHSWDLARATGQGLDLDRDYAAAAHAGMSAMGDALYEGGQFGRPIVDLPSDADPVDRLVALIGRDPAWVRP